MLTCSKFVTTSDYAPRIRARLAVEQQLIHDATSRGWAREIERHQATHARLEHLLSNLSKPTCIRRSRRLNWICTHAGSLWSPSSAGRHSSRSPRARANRPAHGQRGAHKRDQTHRVRSVPRPDQPTAFGSAHRHIAMQQREVHRSHEVAGHGHGRHSGNRSCSDHGFATTLAPTVDSVAAVAAGVSGATGA